MTEKMEVILFNIFVIIMGIAAIVLIKLGDQKSIEEYNNGYCKECSTKYETSYVIDEGHGYIVYKCPHCYKMGNIDAYLAE